MSKGTLEIFKENWERQIAKIEKEAIDSDGVNLIRLHFQRDRAILELSMNEREFTRQVQVELDMLESKLTIALETARSRYRLRNRGLWARIFGGIIEKIPKK